MCFGCLKEPSHRDGSFEYQQHMISSRNKNNNFQSRTLICVPDDFSFGMYLHSFDNSVDLD